MVKAAFDRFGERKCTIMGGGLYKLGSGKVSIFRQKMLFVQFDPLTVQFVGLGPCKDLLRNCRC